MSFRENLKNELTYANLLIKDLADRSGVSKRTIHSYLCENSSIPSAKAAVRIAQALGVSVEYLVTGHESKPAQDTAFFSPAACAVAAVTEQLSAKHQRLALALVKNIRQFEEAEAP